MREKKEGETIETTRTTDITSAAREVGWKGEGETIANRTGGGLARFMVTGRATAILAHGMDKIPLSWSNCVVFSGKYKPIK